MPPVLISSPEQLAEPVLGRLLEADPDLAAGVEAEAADRARRATIVPMLHLEPGAWDPHDLYVAGSLFGPFAVFVVDGLVTRDVVLADRVATQLVGAGDALAVDEPREALPPTAEAWTVATDTTLAILDARFLTAARRWPWLFSAIARRLGAWADRAALLQAITQLARVDHRVLAMLWHLADRWGTVGPDGVTLPLKLTHEALGRLVGAQRPTVTLALKELRQSGLVQRSGASWLLAESGRALVELEPAGLPKPSRIGTPTEPAAALRKAREMRGRAAASRDLARAQREDAVLTRAELIRQHRRRTIARIATETDEHGRITPSTG